jgi:CubicO group peptidase (beta-lactamase class C family)
MPKPWNRIETWLTLLVGSVGIGLVTVFGLLGYMTATAPLHPEPDNVPSVAHADPARAWAEAAERARAIMHAALIEQNLPGLSAAVGVGGEIVWAEGFGWADLEKRVPVAPEMRFRIGTASVALTSAAVGLLLEKDVLKLDEAIQTRVPAFPEKDWPVTLRQIMGHVAGLANDGGDESALYSRHCESPVEALPSFAGVGLRFEPGTQYRYSNYGWILVSAAIEAAAGVPFLTFMREKVFDPLGMRETTAESATNPLRDRATFYFPRFAADPKYGQHLMRELDLSCYAGASVFLSTPSDLVRFGMAIDGSRLLQPGTVDVLQTPQRLRSGEETGYGLGWDLDAVTLRGAATRVVGHDGDSLGGQVASLMIFRERGLVVAVISNISYADTSLLALQAAEAFAAAARP